MRRHHKEACLIKKMLWSVFVWIVSFCVLNPLWFKSSTNFIGRMFRDRIDFFGLCSCVPHYTFGPISNCKSRIPKTAEHEGKEKVLKKVFTSLRIHRMVTLSVRKETSLHPKIFHNEAEIAEKEILHVGLQSVSNLQLIFLCLPN